MAEPGVLVTRPRGQADSLGVSLQQLGCRPVYCPMLEIQAQQELTAKQRQILLNLADYDHVIVVSANAARLGMDWVESCWPQLPAGIEWYTVGDGSAAALAEFGVRARQPASELTSEGLLALPSLQSVAGQRVLILKGAGGRQFLRETLQQRGARVDELALYQRRCPPLAPGELATIIRDGQCQVLLLSSGEGLRNMVSLLTEAELPAVQALPTVVPGARVAEQARALGFEQVLCAANATDRAMIEILQQHLAGGG